MLKPDKERVTNSRHAPRLHEPVLFPFRIGRGCNYLPLTVFDNKIISVT